MLPPVEQAAAVRRAAAESSRGSRGRVGAPGDNEWRGIAPHLIEAYEAGREHGWALRRRDPESGELIWWTGTRVVPRGQHRNKTLLGGGGLYPHERFTAERVEALLPRWRRGELRHAERQLKRATAFVPHAPPEFVDQRTGRA